MKEMLGFENESDNPNSPFDSLLSINPLSINRSNKRSDLALFRSSTTPM